MTAKIGIFCLGHRRPEMYVAHAKQLAKCKNKDFQFYILGCDPYEESQVNELKEILGDRISLCRFEKTAGNYMDKIWFSVNQSHEFAVKHDEDCFLLSESWDRLFALADNMSEEDLCATGVISNGIPTVDLFIEHHTPEIKDELFKDFCNIRLGFHAADYSSLNEDYKEWNPEYFYSKVKMFKHHYKGIHPVRISLECVKKINRYIIDNFKKVMTPKNTVVIKDNTIYPYFCNGVMIIRTAEWKTIVTNRSLYVDGFDEVPLNKYREMTNKNFVIDTGLPIIHTMYNWTPDWDYENNLISDICKEADLCN